MANTSSAKKALRQNIKNRVANKSQISEVRTFAKKVESEIANANSENAIAALKNFEKIGMKAVSKQLFHINTVARKISKLYASIKKIQAK